MENEIQKVQEVQEVQQPKAKKQPKAETKPVDLANYNKFTDLKFLELSGAKLKDEQKKELTELEKELKSCTGKVPVRSVRAAIKNEIALLVEGIPVPEEIEKLIVGAGEKAVLYYFGE